jgi:uncharacterized protein (UPF0333 family)
MFIHLNKKAQSTLEYAVIIAVVVGALLAMQAYIKRGISGRLRTASDDIGEQFSAGYSNITLSTNTTMSTNETATGGALPLTTTVTTQSQNRQSAEDVLALKNEFDSSFGYTATP